MIVPTIGRVVYFHPAAYELSALQQGAAMVQHDPSKPFDAHIVYVWSDTCVNLVIFDHNGNQHIRTSVPINHGDTGGSYAEWMPYQVGQAKKHEGAAGIGIAPSNHVPTGSPIVSTSSGDHI